LGTIAAGEFNTPDCSSLRSRIESECHGFNFNENIIIIIRLPTITVSGIIGESLALGVPGILCKEANDYKYQKNLSLCQYLASSDKTIRGTVVQQMSPRRWALRSRSDWLLNGNFFHATLNYYKRNESLFT
jgi:hypothetical protein